MTAPLNWLGATLIALALCWLGPIALDTAATQPIVVDNHIEHHLATELQAAQNDAARQQRRDRGARDLCVAEHGPQTTWADQPDGSIRCITRRGSVASTHASAQLAQKAQP